MANLPANKKTRQPHFEFAALIIDPGIKTLGSSWIRNFVLNPCPQYQTAFQSSGCNAETRASTLHTG
jgi:hypothetical protein